MEVGPLSVPLAFRTRVKITVVGSDKSFDEQSCLLPPCGCPPKCPARQRACKVKTGGALGPVGLEAGIQQFKVYGRGIKGYQEMKIIGEKKMNPGWKE